MIPTVRAFLLSVLFSLVFLLESEGAPSEGHRIVHEGAPGDDALQVVLQGLSLLQEETRQEWQEALRLLEKRTQEEMRRKDAEMKALLEALVLRIKDMEKRVSALDQDKLECAGGREDFDRLNGRLSRLEDCLQRAVDGCSTAGAPPTPASSAIPSTAHSSVTSSTTSLSSHPSSSTSNATNYTSASASTPSSSSSSPSSNSTLIPTSASSPVSSSTPSTPNTSAFPSSASASSSTPAPSPSEASEAQPSAASAAPPTADPALRKALGGELYIAAENGNTQEVERLLDAGADPNYATKEGFTPLMAASRKGHAPVVSLLLRRGADVHAASSYGLTALHTAAILDRIGHVVPLLVAAGARVDSRNKSGWTPLHVAAAWDNEAAVRALVTAGASKTLKDNDGRIPLDCATSDAVRALLRP